MFSYHLDPRAKRDLESARDWYDRQRAGLGDEFLNVVFDVIRTVRERPTSFPEIYRGVRGVTCDPFPYRVYFDPAGNHVAVLAVYHASRDPERWSDHGRK